MRHWVLSRSRRSLSGLAFFFCVFVILAAAQTPATANEKYAAMVVDHHTGKVLFARHVDAPRFPASLTKIMTLYLLFDEIQAGRVRLSDRITISRHAAAMPPSKLGLKAGSTIRVEDAIRALVTKSANDIAAAVGEHVAGTESAFARKMTRKARELGMSRTTFRNASGLPNSEQRTTARDMITMSRAIMTNHPRYYRYFSTRSFRYKGRAYSNHNRLLGSVRGVDGIKTGYTRASGFNLTTSLKKDGRHVVAVVMGGRTGKSRNQHMVSLLSRHTSKAVARKSPPRVPPGVLVAQAEVPLPLARPRTDNDPIAAAIVMSDTPATPPQEAQQQQIAVATATSFIAPTAPPAQPQVPNVLPQTASEITVTPSAAPTDQQTAALAPTDEPVGEGDAAADNAEVADIPPGWAIQIGAVGSKDEALALIDRARTGAPGAISGRVPFTEPTVKNGVTYVRARFAGFDTPDKAKAACKVMKKRGFGCFPILL